MIDISARIRDAEFRATCRRYAAASGKTLQMSAYRMLSKLAYAAAKRLRPARGFPPIPTSAKGAGDWALVRWLAVGRLQDDIAAAAGGRLTRTRERDWRARPEFSANGFEIAGHINRTRLWVRGDDGRVRRASLFGPDSKGFLTRFAQAEMRGRRKSRNYIKALLYGLGKAAKLKGAARQGTGIVGMVYARPGSTRAESSYTYKSETTRALQPRTDDGMERRVEQAMTEATPEVIADTETYIRRKMAEAARRAGFNARA